MTGLWNLESRSDCADGRKSLWLTNVAWEVGFQASRGVKPSRVSGACFTWYGTLPLTDHQFTPVKHVCVAVQDYKYREERSFVPIDLPCISEPGRRHP